MGKLIFISILVALFQLPGDFPLKKGKPTGKGVGMYVEQKAPSVLAEFQNYVKDTLYDVWFYSSDEKDVMDPDQNELGRHYPNEIYIAEAGEFVAYELADLTARQQKSYRECNRFVKTVMLHELCHEYVYQLSVEMEALLRLPVDRAYRTGVWIVVSHETYGSSFVHEGLSEYLCGAMGELISPAEQAAPASVAELLDRDRQYEMKYKYGAAFLKPFLDTIGFKKGVQVLLHNPPPSHEEILEPGRFFSRLIIPELLAGR